MQCEEISGTASNFIKKDVEESVAPPVTPKILEGADGTRSRRPWEDRSHEGEQHGRI